MELDNIYTNVNYDQVKQDRKQQNLKSDHGGVQSVQGKWSSLVIYIFLGISILLSVVTLITAVILFTQLFTIMKMLETDFKMGLAQLQHNELSGKCPEDWRRFQQNCYYFSSESKTWTEAQRACASLDANLVVINKPEEQAFIKTLIQNKRYWIGLTDSISEGHWRWVDGMDYTSSVKFWSEGEPNNASDEDCAEIYSNGGWNDRSCDVSQQWICEKPAQLDSP
ncbi:CD209 antigen-like protein C isoform X2 [Hemiscyllium ocellatum]|uniref:CD209 antigen-like protein C isoform X2 n=1 Tax=Hemiscyllium ocellatum TaxID=170820 RepID=UPI0029674EDA|nr:CD209 antigen-like protein C isoform X2 [Hemiscyllium ocellatum]